MNCDLLINIDTCNLWVLFSFQVFKHFKHSASKFLGKINPRLLISFNTYVWRNLFINKNIEKKHNKTLRPHSTIFSLRNVLLSAPQSNRWSLFSIPNFCCVDDSLFPFSALSSRLSWHSTIITDFLKRVECLGKITSSQPLKMIFIFSHQAENQ